MMRPIIVVLVGLGMAIVGLNRTSPANLRVDYGSGAHGRGKVTLRSAATGLPVPMMFGVSVKYRGATTC